MVGLWREWEGRQPLLFRTAAAHVALCVVFACLAMLDSTEITGLNRWIKPMKFTSSIAIYLGTMAWFWPVAIASETVKWRAARILAYTLIFEIVIIGGQAMRGVRSHFNIGTPMDGALFQMMGIAILINIFTAGAVLRWTFRAAPSPYVWGIRLGLLCFIVFALEGGVMAQRLAHSVGVPDGGPGLPVLNWSTTGGDLRVAHFLGMHALQILPAVGFLTRSMAAVAAAFAAWATLAGVALWRAMEGLPLA